jgi:hypothetical protein
LFPAKEFWDPLEGSLESVTFSTKPRYIALSYTWADPDVEHAALPAMPAKKPGEARPLPHIKLNTVHGDSKRKYKPSYNMLPLFHNVTLALRFLRSRKHSLNLWVDVVCIDQGSISERNAQVALMAFIFTRAAGVICWLGVPRPLPIEVSEDGFKDDLRSRVISYKSLSWYHGDEEDETDVELDEGFGGPTWLDEQEQVLRGLPEYRYSRFDAKFDPARPPSVKKAIERLIQKLIWVKKRHERARDALRKLWKSGTSRTVAQRLEAWSGPSRVLVKVMGGDGPEYEQKSLFTFANPDQVEADAITAENMTGMSFNVFNSIAAGNWVPSIHQNPYWGRLWIVQEICLPRDLAFMVGGELWSERTIREMTTRWKSSRSRAVSSFSSDDLVEMMSRLLDARKERFLDAMRLEALIERFMTNGCGEIRDRVFALVGLANDVDSVVPNPHDTRESNDSDQNDSPEGDDGHNRDNNHHRDDDRYQENHGRRRAKKRSSSPPVRYIRLSEELRTRGSLQIDYTRSLYDIWTDVVEYMYYRAKPLQDFGSAIHDIEDERCVRVVRFAGVVQKAFDNKIETELAQRATDAVDGVSLRTVILTKGYVAGTIVHLGSGYSEFVASYWEQQRWVSSWELNYRGAELSKLRQMEEEYSTKILSYGDSDLARITTIRSHHNLVWPSERRKAYPVKRSGAPIFYEQLAIHARNAKPTDPVRFLGTNFCIGMVPPEARSGDLIVRFWNCDAAIVVRPALEGQPFYIVGRADVAELKDRDLDGDYIAREMLKRSYSIPYDRTGDDKPPSTGSPGGAVYAQMDFETLQKISASIAI